MWIHVFETTTPAMGLASRPLVIAITHELTLSTTDWVGTQEMRKPNQTNTRNPNPNRFPVTLTLIACP